MVLVTDSMQELVLISVILLASVVVMELETRFLTVSVLIKVLDFV